MSSGSAEGNGAGGQQLRPGGPLWLLKDSGLTLGEMGATAGFEQRREGVGLVPSRNTLTVL